MCRIHHFFVFERSGNPLAKTAADEPFAAGEKPLCDRADEKNGKDGAKPDSAAQKQPDDHKDCIAGHPNPAELEALELVGEDHRDKVVGAGARIGTDDQRHAGGEDDAAENRDQDPYWQRQSTMDPAAEQKGEQVDDRAAAEGADHGSGKDIAPG